MSSWITRIAQIRDVHREIMEIAPYRDLGLVPNPSARQPAVARAERRLGRSLPPSYQSFLLRHDGWPRFFEGAHLLGTRELGHESYADLARAVFEAAETPVPDDGPPSLPDGRPRVLLPFGIDPQGTTLFAFDPSTAGPDGEMEVVAWVSEIGIRCDDFDDFLRTVLHMSSAELEALTTAPLSAVG